MSFTHQNHFNLLFSITQQNILHLFLLVVQVSSSMISQFFTKQKRVRNKPLLFLVDALKYYVN